MSTFAVSYSQPQLSSSIGLLELSGEQCPRLLTLTCDDRNFGVGGSINWFVWWPSYCVRCEYSLLHSTILLRAVLATQQTYGGMPHIRGKEEAGRLELNILGVMNTYHIPMLSL